MSTLTKPLSLLVGVLTVLSLCSLVVTVHADSSVVAWRTAVVDASGDQRGEYNSLALDASGYPHISYFDGSPNYTLKYAYQDAGGWHVTTLAYVGSNAGVMLGGTSIALDASGYPHICYFDMSNVTLKYAYEDGSGWHFETVEVNGFNPSLALDAYGYPHISYYDHANVTVKYAYQDGSGWHITTIAAGYSESDSSLALDANGYPHISYSYATSTEAPSTSVLKYIYQDGSGWHNVTIDTIDNAGFPASYSLALDASGYPHIGYDYIQTLGASNGPGPLKYAYQDAGGWHITTVGSAGDTESAISLALDSQGNPRMSYESATDGTLKYAYEDGSGWHNTTVDSNAVNGYYNSLALDANGQPHISYLGSSSTANSLNYAYWVTAVTLNASAPATVCAKHNFTIDGSLSASNTGIPGATITLQRSTDSATWNNVTTNVTNATGGYQLSTNETATATYYYRTAYDGNATYANATSNLVSVNVVGVAGAPAVSAQSTKSLDLFFRGSDNALWWKHWNGTAWTTATSFGGILTSDPSTASPSSGQIAVFVRGNDSAIWEKTSTDGGSTWSGWHSLGGQIPAGTSPTVCSWGSGRLDVFVQGTDGQLWHKWYTGTSWSGWQSLGGKLTSSAAAATAPGSSRIDVFVRGTDGAIWQRTTTNKGSSWSGWTSRGGQIPVNTVPAACSWTSGRVDLFANGTDGQLWWKYTTNGGSSWTGWQALGRPLGESLTSSPAAAAPSSGAMDVFVRGADYGLWERTYGSSSWSGWTSIAL